MGRESYLIGCLVLITAGIAPGHRALTRKSNLALAHFRLTGVFRPPLSYTAVSKYGCRSRREVHPVVVDLAVDNPASFLCQFSHLCFLRYLLFNSF
jgi:hypothetical protein